MNNVEKAPRIRMYMSEFIGTLILTLFGCGTAVLTGSLLGAGSIMNVTTTALAFGLSIVVVGYTFGKASGTHVNPAVTFAKWLQKEISLADMLWYLLCQFVGAIAGAILVFFLACGLAAKADGTGIASFNDALGSIGLGSNVSGAFNVAYSGQWAWTNYSVNGVMYLFSIVTELVLTFVFITVVLFATEKENKHAPLLIGAGLTFVHLLGIMGPTGTSVNPARSFGPALLDLFRGNWAPIADIWIFLIVPIGGAVLAWLFHRFMNYIRFEKKAVVNASEEPAQEENPEPVEE